MQISVEFVSDFFTEIQVDNILYLIQLYYIYYIVQLLDGISVQYGPRCELIRHMNTYDIEGYCVAILNWWFGARWFGFLRSPCEKDHYEKGQL